MLYSLDTCYIHKRNYAILSYNLNLEPRSLLLPYMHVITSLSKVVCKYIQKYLLALSLAIYLARLWRWDVWRRRVRVWRRRVLGRLPVRPLVGYVRRRAFDEVIFRFRWCVEGRRTCLYGLSLWDYFIYVMDDVMVPVRLCWSQWYSGIVIVCITVVSDPPVRGATELVSEPSWP